jgi:hypothetical protein
MKAKKYWYRVYLQSDKNLQERGFKRWKERTKDHLERELQNAENEVISSISELNQEIGEITVVEES